MIFNQMRHVARVFGDGGPEFFFIHFQQEILFRYLILQQRFYEC